jgi:thiamine biosynthesis protein ThiS
VTVVLNGRDQEAPDGATVLALLETVGVRPGQVAVEVNGRIVRRAEFSRVTLSERDRIEVVHFVGGG